MLVETWGRIFHAWMRPLGSTLESTRIHRENVFDDKKEPGGCLFMVLVWSGLYVAYEKCLHLLLRRMQYPVVKRRKIIDALWCTGFALISTFYLKFFVPGSVDAACILEKPRYLELGVVLHKSFYLHRAIAELTAGAWLRGWTSLIFCLIVHSSSQLKWFDLVGNLLLFRATSTAIINVCRILSVVSVRRRAVVKVLLGIYLFNLIYVHALVVPDFTLWNSKGLKNDTATVICMWIWLIMEFLCEIKNIRLGYLNTNQWIEAYLFPPPSKESTELSTICKKLREASRDKIPENIESKKTAQLWQMLSCAMIMKKKVKRLREAKESLSPSASS